MSNFDSAISSSKKGRKKKGQVKLGINREKPCQVPG
jgi:hypothetical protein